MKRGPGARASEQAGKRRLAHRQKVASSVFHVQVRETTNGEKLFAFIIDVKPGHTAYQADDKKYYVRRSGQKEPMEDKDIRLRMLAADKPRVSIGLEPRIIRGGYDGPPEIVHNVTWNLFFENVGVTTIPSALIRTKLSFHGLSEPSCNIISSRTPEYQRTDFGMENIEHNGLLPGQRFEEPLIQIARSAFTGCPDATSVTMTADIFVFIDNGLPSEVRSYDLMTDIRPIVHAEWGTV